MPSIRFTSPPSRGANVAAPFASVIPKNDGAKAGFSALRRLRSDGVCRGRLEPVNHRPECGPEQRPGDVDPQVRPATVRENRRAESGAESHRWIESGAGDRADGECAHCHGDADREAATFSTTSANAAVNTTSADSAESGETPAPGWIPGL